jgi:hypothetical protein
MGRLPRERSAHGARALARPTAPQAAQPPRSRLDRAHRSARRGDLAHPQRGLGHGRRGPGGAGPAVGRALRGGRSASRAAASRAAPVVEARQRRGPRGGAGAGGAHGAPRSACVPGLGGRGPPGRRRVAPGAQRPLRRAQGPGPGRGDPRRRLERARRHDAFPAARGRRGRRLDGDRRPRGPRGRAGGRRFALAARAVDREPAEPDAQALAALARDRAAPGAGARSSQRGLARPCDRPGALAGARRRARERGARCAAGGLARPLARALRHPRELPAAPQGRGRRRLARDRVRGHAHGALRAGAAGRSGRRQALRGRGGAGRGRGGALRSCERLRLR